MGAGREGEREVSAREEVVLGLEEFPGWLEESLAVKYASTCDTVLHEGVRPLLLLFRAVHDQAEELSNALLRCNDPELLPFKKNAEDIARVVHLLVARFPVCIDYDFLTSYVLASSQAASNIAIFLLPFRKIASEDYSSECRDCVATIERLLKLQPQQVTKLQEHMERNSHCLRKLSALKLMFHEFSLSVRKELDDMVGAGEHLDQYAELSSRHNSLHASLMALQQEPLLLRGSKLRTTCSSMLDILNGILEPYFRVCAQLKSKRKAIKGEVLTQEETAAIHHMSSIMVKGEIYYTIREHMQLSSFCQFLHMISHAAGKNALAISKKNQQLLIEAEETFSEDHFHSVYSQWSKCIGELETLEKTSSHQELRAEYLRLHEDYRAVQQAYRSAAVLVEVDLVKYQKCALIAERLRAELAACCAQEFGISVRLDYAKDLPPIPEKLREIEAT